MNSHFFYSIPIKKRAYFQLLEQTTEILGIQPNLITKDLKDQDLHNQGTKTLNLILFEFIKLFFCEKKNTPKMDPQGSRRKSSLSSTQSIPIQFIPTHFIPKQISSPTSSGIQLIPTHFIPTYNVPKDTSYIGKSSFKPGSL